jgi:hypothetical protein
VALRLPPRDRARTAPAAVRVWTCYDHLFETFESEDSDRLKNTFPPLCARQPPSYGGAAAAAPRSCSYGPRCTGKGTTCHFIHPPDPRYFPTHMCNYGDNCIRKGECNFMHPR